MTVVAPAPSVSAVAVVVPSTVGRPPMPPEKESETVRSWVMHVSETPSPPTAEACPQP